MDSAGAFHDEIIEPPLSPKLGATSPTPMATVTVVDSDNLAFRSRLYALFGQIEKEFETLFAENMALQAKVEALTEQLAEGGIPPERTAEMLTDISTADAKANAKKTTQMGQKLKTALKVPPPGRLVSSFKAGVGVGGGDGGRGVRYVRCFEGHRDGIWDLDAAPSSSSASAMNSSHHATVIASASADQTARLWWSGSGECLGQYTGHRGSVNSVAFSPSYVSGSGNNSSTNSDSGGHYHVLLTASGDQSAHIWKIQLPSDKKPGIALAGTHSSEDELDPSSEKEDDQPAGASCLTNVGGGGTDSNNHHSTNNNGDSIRTVSTPLLQLTGHTGVVICAKWLHDGNQIITASWDRTANIYDAEKGEVLNILSGHDQELTVCDAHASQKLVVTASKDTTFRLWDFREPIHSVAVFQGHIDAVNSVVFAPRGDGIVSGSEDRTVKVWDLRNMRSPLTTLRLDSPVNRLSVNDAGVIAIPHDNRHVRLYDLHGVRVARLPRSNRRSHRRMVCGTCWADDTTLFTCGFDKMLLSWKLISPKE